MKKRALALCLALLMLAGCGGKPEEEAPPPEPTYSATGRGNPNVPKNEYSAQAFVSVGGFKIYTAANAASHIGVDVSTYQGDIDWPQVKAAGVEFAMIRAGFRGYGSSGNIHQDSRFPANIQGALDAGLKVGVYFFSQAVSAEEALVEAESILAWIQPYQITYPVVFDWENVEDPSARTHGVDAETVTACAKAFCGAVQEAGYTPMVYFNRNQGYGVINLEELKDCEFWLAGYTAVPDFEYGFQMWQYSSNGVVPGIEMAVDLNICMVDYPEGSKLAMARAAEEAEEGPDGGEKDSEGKK